MIEKSIGVVSILVILLVVVLVMGSPVDGHGLALDGWAYPPPPEVSGYPAPWTYVEPAEPENYPANCYWSTYSKRLVCVTVETVTPNRDPDPVQSIPAMAIRKPYISFRILEKKLEIAERCLD